MALHTIQNDRVLNQQHFSRMDKSMLRTAFYHFLDTLIRENATHNNDSYSLFASKLSIEDKKIFLSYIVTPDDFDNYNQNNVRLDAAINDHLKDMQYLIDDRIDEVYHDDMREMGLALAQHNDNGEFFYYKR